MDAQGLYLENIGRFPVLSAEEQTVVAETYIAGRQAQERIDAGEDTAENRRLARLGRRAKQRFFECNLKLVVSIAKKYPIPEGMEQIDLIQEGNLGLEHAIRKFDPSKGFRFSTYANFWIRQHIGRAIEQYNAVRVPGDKLSEARRILRHSQGDYSLLTPEQTHIVSATNPISLNLELAPHKGDSKRGTSLVDIVSQDDLRFNDVDPLGQILYDLMDTRGDMERTFQVLRDNLKDSEMWLLLKRHGIYDKGKRQTFAAIAAEEGKSPESTRRRYVHAQERAAEVLAEHGIDLGELLGAGA